MCPNCQAPTRDDEDFCTSCGTQLRRDGAAAQQQGLYPPAPQPIGQQPPTRVVGQAGPVSDQPQQQWAPQPAAQQQWTPQPVAQQPWTSPPPPQPAFGQPGQQSYQEATQLPPSFGQPAQQAPPFGQQAQQPFGQQPPAQAQFGGPPAPGWQGQAQRSSTPSFRLDIKRLGQTDLIIGGATIVMFIALFLPWYSYLSYSANGLTAHGYLAISLIVALALIAYLVLRAGWDVLPFRLPVAHAPLLLIATAVQWFFVLIAVVFSPAPFLSRDIGAYLALIAAAVACGAIAVPAIKSLQGNQR